MMSEILQSEASGNGLRLDPRTKLALMVIVNLVIFSAAPFQYILVMAAVPILLIAFSGYPLRALYAAGAMVAATVAIELLVPRVHGIMNILVVMFSSMICRLMPGLIMGYYLLTTTTVSEFSAAMERLRVPQNISIPLLVMFRFFPTIIEESRSISDAMRMRDLGFGSGAAFKRPLEIIEYRLVPLMMSAVKIGNELSAASLTRGLGSPVKRTNICEIGFRLPDYLFICVSGVTYLAFLCS